MWEQISGRTCNDSGAPLKRKTQAQRYNHRPELPVYGDGLDSGWRIASDAPFRMITSLRCRNRSFEHDMIQVVAQLRFLVSKIGRDDHVMRHPALDEWAPHILYSGGASLHVATQCV